jgi:hypothetical protein
MLALDLMSSAWSFARIRANGKVAKWDLEYAPGYTV